MRPKFVGIRFCSWRFFSPADFICNATELIVQMPEKLMPRTQSHTALEMHLSMIRPMKMRVFTLSRSLCICGCQSTQLINSNVKNSLQIYRLVRQHTHTYIPIDRKETPKKPSPIWHRKIIAIASCSHIYTAQQMILMYLHFIKLIDLSKFVHEFHMKIEELNEFMNMWTRTWTQIHSCRTRRNCKCKLKLGNYQKYIIRLYTIKL